MELWPNTKQEGTARNREYFIRGRVLHKEWAVDTYKVKLNTYTIIIIILIIIIMTSSIVIKCSWRLLQ